METVEVVEIVIKIPKNYYDACKNAQIITSGMRSGKTYFQILVDALCEGTVLPKGHGVLKDVTNLMRGLYTDIQTIEETFMSSDVYKMIDEECPTVIEADREDT